MPRAHLLRDLRGDLAFAFRLLRRSPGFALVSVLSLGLGIGANTAIFTLIKRSFLELLPVPKPHRMMSLAQKSPSHSGGSFSYPLYRDMALGETPFQGLLCRSRTTGTLVASDGAAAEAVSIELVSGNYFEVFQVKPHVARLLTPDDDRAPGGHPVAVLSHNYWRRRFGSNRAVVGRTVRINSQPMTVVGVAPLRFGGVSQEQPPDVFVPVAMQAQVFQTQSWIDSRGFSWLGVAGRLRPGATERQAEAAMKRFLDGDRALRGRRPDSTVITVRPMATGWLRSPDEASKSMALLGVTGVVLLAACLNLANLLLARASARRGEMAMRLALGAGRVRLVRQLLTESAVVAGLGAALGLVLAVVTGPFVLRMANGESAQFIESEPDVTILAFNLALATICGLVFGLAPALHSVRTAAMKTTAGERMNGRKFMLSAQIALTLVLLVCAALFVRTVARLQSVDLGFAPEHLIQLTPLVKNAGYSDAQVLPYLQQVVDRLRHLPGVRAASFSAQRLLTNSGWSSGIAVEGVKVDDNDRGPNRDAVGPGYFSTTGIAIRAGREFDENDTATSPKVAIVNEAFAKFYFGGANPIGRKIDEGGNRNAPRLTIVGVVSDGKYKSIREASTRFWYVPLGQSGQRDFITIYVRVAGDPSLALSSLRNAISQVDPNVALHRMKTVPAQIAEGQRFERLIATLASFFGILATVLAAIGLYGILSYLVQQRQREIGVRLALGATPGSVIRLVVSGIAGWVGLGVALAMPAVYYATNAVRSVLYGVDSLDPVALVCAALVLAVVAVVAILPPALRAAQISPSVALTAE